MLGEGRNSYSKPARIASFCCCFFFKDGERLLSPRPHRFIYGVNQGNEETG